jgi:hypothetical protein
VFYHRQLLATDSSKPKYLIDQENGISHLVPKVFDGKWRPVRANDGKESRDGWNRDALIVLTYNVWFDKRNKEARSLALMRILDASNADVICLQEVTPEFLFLLRDQTWVRQRYLLSDSVGKLHVSR